MRGLTVHSLSHARAGTARAPIYGPRSAGGHPTSWPAATVLRRDPRAPLVDISSRSCFVHVLMVFLRSLEPLSNRGAPRFVQAPSMRASTSGATLRRVPVPRTAGRRWSPGAACIQSALSLPLVGAAAPRARRSAMATQAVAEAQEETFTYQAEASDAYCDVRRIPEGPTDHSQPFSGAA